MVWLNVGRRERRLLFLLLERDEPRERIIAVWGAVYREFKIDYVAYRTKKEQMEMLCEERCVRRAFWRVFRLGWARPVWAVPGGGFSFVCSSLGGGGDFVFCVLTAKGRLVAEQLRRQEWLLGLDVDGVVGLVVGQLWGLGFVFVSVGLVLDFLWGHCFEGFVDRVEFERFWSGKRLGGALRRCGVVRSGVDVGDGRRRYCLAAGSFVGDGAV